MFKRFLAFFILFISLILPNIIHAQRSIGEVKAPPTKAVEPNYFDFTVEEYVGKRFVFLQKPKDQQKKGYRMHLDGYHLRPGYNPELETEDHNLKYDRFVGKIVKVIAIEKLKYGGYNVIFLEEESNMKIYSKGSFDYIDGIALLEDLSKAKERWLGKLIFSKVRAINTYNAELDKYGEVKVKIGDALKVNDIGWGNISFFPLWVIVETSKGEKGFIPVAFSWTNIPFRWTDGRPWDNAFFEFNPKEKYGWSDEIWELIDNGEARIGMNKEQVRLSWGKPKKINKDIYRGRIQEQWIYESQYLYFENDRLTAIQSR